MNYLLKHFDRPLILFQLRDEGLRGTRCEILQMAEESRALFPIGMEPTGAGLLSWLRSRTIPKNRGYVEALLASMQLRENDLEGILNVCLGLSLNDCYWVVREDFQGSFADYNLYEHDFTKAISLIAYTGYGSVKAKGFSSSPEFTTNGMLRKGWRRLQGKILLYKGGTEGAANTGNEPYSEFYAAQIARTMGLHAIDYSLARWKKSVCSVCELFTSQQLSYVPIWRFGNFPTLPDISDFLKTLGQSFYDEFADMMVFDALIYNTDRHQGNFGLLVDNFSNKTVAPAPIFDNGLGLFPYAMMNDMENLNAYAATRASAFDVSFDKVAKAYMSHRQREQLKKMIGFRFTPDKNYNLPAARLRALERFIQSRVQEMLSW